MATRYTTVSELKVYGLDDPTVTNPLKDPVLEQAISRAEMAIDLYTGTRFDAGGVAGENARAWVDGDGWLWINVRRRGPVTALSAVQLRNLAARMPWQIITWQVDDLLLPYVDAGAGGPPVDGWQIRLYPAQLLPPLVSSQCVCQVSYTAGYATIPGGLKGITNRLAWWIYKLGEAPLGIVRNVDMHLMEVPVSIPPDIQADLNLWRPAA